MPPVLISIAIFALVLSVLVLIHEFGHFFAAKLFGIRVEEFALGLPFTKALGQFRVGETIYSIYPLLFGGFVRLHGEESEEKVDTTRSFWSRGRRQRMIVIMAGVVMNIVLAYVLFVGFYLALGIPTKTVNKVTIVEVQAGSPAETAGLKADDRIVSVEGKSVTDGAELSRLMKSWAGTPVNLGVESGKRIYLLDGVVDNNASLRTVTVTGRLNPPEGQGPLGLNLADWPYTQTVRDPVHVLGYAAHSMVTSIGNVVEGLRQIGVSIGHGKAPEGLSGPIGIYSLVDQLRKYNTGFYWVLQLGAVLSVNLGVLNVLPIPALDGGRMFFIWVEWIRGRRVSVELEQKVNHWGMMILLILIGLISIKDIINLNIFSFLTKYIPH